MSNEFASMDELYKAMGRALKKHCGLGGKASLYGLIGKPPREQIDYTTFAIEVYPKNETTPNPDLIPIMRVIYQALAGAQAAGTPDRLFRSLNIEVQNLRNQAGLEIRVHSDHFVQWESIEMPRKGEAA